MHITKRFFICLLAVLLFLAVAFTAIAFRDRQLQEKRDVNDSAETAGQPASDETEQENRPGPVKLPVLMYHSVCVNKKVQGSPYVLSPQRFREDLAALKAAGYTSVSIRELLAFTDTGAPLPPKPVLLTLDDGFYNAVSEVLPALEAADMCAEVNVVGKFTDDAPASDKNPAWAYLSWEDIKALPSDGRLEVGCHTWDLHRTGTRVGAGRIPGESGDVYAAMLSADLDRFGEALQANGIPQPVVFAYPFGAVGDGSRELLEARGYRVLLTTEEKINLLSPGEKTLVLGRFNRDSRLSTAEMMEKIGDVL